MSDQPQAPQHRDIPVVWVDSGQPVHFINAMMSQFQPNEFVLSFGQLVPPPIVAGTEQERLAQMQNVQFVPVNHVVKLAMTRDRVVEMIKMLQDNLENHDQAMANR